MNIDSLKQSLTTVMPILDANLCAAGREYKAGDLAAGAFHYIRSRHETALEVLSRNDLDADAAFKACALLAIDLRSGMKESTVQSSNTQAHVDAWWQCFRDAGYTAVNQYFNAPMLPAPATGA